MHSSTSVKWSTQFENIHIHSFEPIPAIFDVLQKNSELSNNPYFKVYQNGIGEKNEEKTWGNRIFDEIDEF